MHHRSSKIDSVKGLQAENFSGKDYSGASLSVSVPQTTESSTGKKKFELTNHLGNFLALIGDRKQKSQQSTQHQAPEVVNLTDYYPFGMVMPGRSYAAEDYRYGFQSQEEDDELWGRAVSYKYRVEDPRLGRFFSVDPLAPDYPHNSPYAFSENVVIHAVELEGLEKVELNDGSVIETGPTSKEATMEKLVNETNGGEFNGVGSDGSIYVGLPPAEVVSYEDAPVANIDKEVGFSPVLEPWEPLYEPNRILVREIDFNVFIGGGMSVSLVRVGDGVSDEWFFRIAGGVGADVSVTTSMGFLEPAEINKFSINQDFEGRDFSGDFGFGWFNLARSGDHPGTGPSGGPLFRLEGEKYTVYSGGVGKDIPVLRIPKTKIGFGGSYNWGHTFKLSN